MKRIEYFFEKTLPGQFIGVLCAAAVPFLLCIILKIVLGGTV